MLVSMYEISQLSERVFGGSGRADKAWFTVMISCAL